MKQLLILTAALIAIFAAMRVSGQGRIVEMGITSAEMAQYFQQHAGAQDIARVDHPNDIGLISNITVGKKMVIFKSAAQIQQFMTSNTSALDIIGYNLEPGQTHDANELANPVAAAKAVQAIARQYGKQVAIGLTRSLALQYGAAMAPYADIWVLQIQKAQNDPAMAGEFVSQMLPALQRANPSIVVFVQIRTDSSPAALAKLVNGLGNVHVSILTQRSDVQDAVNVASAFFGSSGQAQTVSQGQPVGDYGQRLQGANGWLLPVATKILGSDEEKHLGRGSVNAWDLVAPKDSAIYAMAPGVVEYAGCNNAGGYGCWVLLQHADGYSSEYGHMIEGSIRVRQGQQVDASTLLGQVGWTGKTSFGPHTHFEIRKGGKFLRIDGFFNINAMKQCNLCSVNGDPVTAQGVTTGQQQQATVTTVATSKGVLLLQALASLPADQFALLVSIVIGVLMFTWWLSGTYVRVVILATVTTVVVGGCIALLFMPTMVQATAAGQQSATIGGDWVKSYEITQGREGWKCTHDPVRTMGGVTQGTYTRWLAKHGMGNADVCSSLTRDQAKQIFYELFWLPVGADKMPMALAITVVDHYYNTGSVSRLLAQCGQDVACFNQARIADYKTKGNCAAYCTAWINRVNHIRTLTEGN